MDIDPALTPRTGQDRGDLRPTVCFMALPIALAALRKCEIYGMIRSSRSLVSCRLKLSCVSIQSAKPALRILIVLRIVSSPKLSIQSTNDQFAICSYGVACSL